MNKLRILLCIFFSASLLTGCGHRASTVDVPSKYSIRQCLKQCTIHYENCKPTCDNNCANCQMQAYKKAAVNYQRYAQQLKISGGYNVRELRSYRDPLQCRKVTCNCSADFLACRQACTGSIHKVLQAAPYCT